jgi:hypothetical protein
MKVNGEKVSVVAYLKVLSLHSHEETKKFRNRFSQDVRLPGRNFEYFPNTIVALPVENVIKKFLKSVYLKESVTVHFYIPSLVCLTAGQLVLDRQPILCYTLGLSLFSLYELFIKENCD